MAPSLAEDRIAGNHVRMTGLRFGPYRMPRCKIGGKLDCEYAGTLRVVAISDAPVQWPLGVVWGHRIPVVTGDLVRAVKQEANCDVAVAWGVGASLVSRWRKALRVKRTKGTRLRRSESIRATDPARARKIAKAKRGVARPPHVIETMRKAHLGKPLPEATRKKMSATHRKRGTRPPGQNPPWSSKEDRLVRTKRPAEVVRLTGRTWSAVVSRRYVLGISRRWTPKLDQIVRTKPPAEAAKLTGRTLLAVYKRRWFLGNQE
ncbi:MAG TPA: hypothetical protein VFV87_21430 [Pirellulaceae bacterium]|nr:hypothetical protein [Pirellulaceae bacterium]